MDEKKQDIKNKRACGGEGGPRFEQEGECAPAARADLKSNFKLTPFFKKQFLYILNK